MLLRLVALVLLGCAGCWGGASDSEPTGGEPEGANAAQGATETNVAPPPCETDDDCRGTRCAHFQLDDGSEGPGFCEAPETESEDG